MSDYTDYSISDEDVLGFSDEDNYAGAYGGYDDLYDDVIEEAGYDAWDVVGFGEFGFDEETYLYNFSPVFMYPELWGTDYDYDGVKVTYNALVVLAEMNCRLIGAWKKRKQACNINDENEENGYDSLSLFWGTFYQLEMGEREELRKYSVRKLLQLFGGEQQVLEFEQEISNISTFLKKCVLEILAPCLPYSLPYPALSTMLSYLLDISGNGGLHNLGLISEDVSKVKEEEELMRQLYCMLTEVYGHLSALMFNVSSVEFPDNSWEMRRESLNVRAKELADLVQVSIVEVDIGVEALTVEDNIEAAVEDNIEAAVEDNIEAAAEDNIEAAVEDNIEAAVDL